MNAERESLTAAQGREWVCSRCGMSTRRGRSPWVGHLVLCDRCANAENQLVTDLDPLQARADAIHLGDRAEDENVRLTRERFNPDGFSCHADPDVVCDGTCDECEVTSNA